MATQESASPFANLRALAAGSILVLLDTKWSMILLASSTLHGISLSAASIRKYNFLLRSSMSRRTSAGDPFLGSMRCFIAKLRIPTGGRWRQNTHGRVATIRRAPGMMPRRADILRNRSECLARDPDRSFGGPQITLEKRRPARAMVALSRQAAFKNIFCARHVRTRLRHR